MGTDIYFRTDIRAILVALAVQTVATAAADWAAARDAAYKLERGWQTERLLAYLGGREGR